MTDSIGHWQAHFRRKQMADIAMMILTDVLGYRRGSSAVDTDGAKLEPVLEALVSDTFLDTEVRSIALRRYLTARENLARAEAAAEAVTPTRGMRQEALRNAKAEFREALTAILPWVDRQARWALGERG